MREVMGGAVYETGTGGVSFSLVRRCGFGGRGGGGGAVYETGTGSISFSLVRRWWEGRWGGGEFMEQELGA